MSNRLVLLLGEFNNSEKGLAAVLQEWSDAGLLATVAWSSVDQPAEKRPKTWVSDRGESKDIDLFELLTSRIWSQVSVVAVRQACLETLGETRFENEVALLQIVEGAFAAHKQLDFVSFTVSIGEEKGLVQRAFSPFWKMHILQEPVVRIDEAVASQPMWEDHRHLLVGLLAVTTAGGFVWQHGALTSGIADQVIGSHRSVRVGRAYLRVVSAGRLTDEVLSGAFPASGPWSIPSDVANCLAVPPGSMISDTMVSAVNLKGGFLFKSWVPPKRERPKTIGILQAIKLFLLEFVNAAKSIPVAFVEKIKEEIEDFVQKTTFGTNSSLLVKFDPSKDLLNLDELLETVRGLQFDYDVDPIGNAEAWETLQRVSMSSIDGGRFPKDIPPPTKGANRLIYTDPSVIGPSPADTSFAVSDFELVLLNLDQAHALIGPMAVEQAENLQLRLKALRDELLLAEASAISVKQEAIKIGKKSKIKTLLSRFRRKRKKTNVQAREVVSQGDQVETVEPPSPEVLNQSPLQTDSETETKPAEEISKVNDGSQHRPTHPLFKQSEYTILTAFYQGERKEFLTEFETANKVHDASIKTYTVTNGFWKTNKSCDHCGTSFDHGFAFLHSPTNEVVHIGRICAKNTFPLASESDLFAQKLSELEKRFADWLSLRSGSLLWRVGKSIIAGSFTARLSLKKSLEILEKRPKVEASAVLARKKFKTLTRRGIKIFILLIAASVASIIFTPLPLLIFVLSLTTYLTAFIIRMIFLAREIVRAQYALRLEMDEFETNYEIARHSVSELARLASVMEQFDDWQIIIREVIHVPFGKDIGFSTSRIGIEEVTRPPAMILGKSRPDEKQKMQLFLNARRQTIHSGWLTETMEVIKDEWRDDYANARITTLADNIIPEADNASSQSIVGKRPLSNDDVYYPRTDLRRRIVSGDLQRKLVLKKAEQVAVDLKRTSLDQLLAQVDVVGLGSALSGQKVGDFLSGLSGDITESVPFPPDLISIKFPNNRLFFPELVLPPPGTLNSESGEIQVKPGIELTAAAWRVELSAPIHPLDVLKGFENDLKLNAKLSDPGPPSQDSPV